MGESADPRALPNGRIAEILLTCVVCITVVAVIFLLIHLAGVLVPLCFAIFLSFLFEPLLAVLVLGPGWFLRLLRRICRCCVRSARANRQLQQQPEAAPGVAGNPQPAASHQLLACPDAGGHDQHRSWIAPGTLFVAEATAAGKTCRRRCVGWLVTFWDAVSCVLCVGVLVGVVGLVALSVDRALQHFDWDEYAHSKKLQKLLDYLKKILDVDHFDFSKYINKDQIFSLVFGVMNVVNSCILTMLLFFFCLVALLPGIHSRRQRSKVQSLMQRYLLMKTISTLIITIAVMMSLWILKVRLLVIWGITTFACNFIPNIGAFFAIILPVPFVFLEPNSNLQDLVMVVLVPFLIHNSLGCVIEPQLMAEGLDLHPLIVVVALTFWGSVWGIAGAVLSVPITCTVRLLLQEVKHPHAQALYALFEAPMGFSVQSPETPQTRDARVEAAPAGSLA